MLGDAESDVERQYAGDNDRQCADNTERQHASDVGKSIVTDLLATRVLARCKLDSCCNVSQSGCAQPAEDAEQTDR